ncbi:phosphoadenosine phosphosulfate reductase [Sinorhizobium meliloti]|uniref:phosphoadenosine phosphosulfate reductase domain-containing protein n=1 Tax=Rhizobium meliloti TaxID=382 RepID=UPI000B4992A2|nr:phosphoadenosine phosphosulfate reductase family protein [Sinorhizobium meliloti]ASP70339.1 phosphoadenosine phosphosulfate reductase [Sinorhizobium meliloti]MDE3854774.1 phosphoadenosine phosphosulfate reductase family protein [Sinorhizobium meliloti]MQW52451.1 phosphoadenosine phosphosulfate reductase family protein [Sinorhizobium meliloti]
MRGQATLFEGSNRLVYDDAIELTLQSMQAYGPAHDHWGIAWSGGKDSTATLTLVVHLIDTGRLQPPKSLTVFYADTRQELLPLAISAERIMQQMAERGIRCEVVRAPLDKRFLVYILGRGVPPPNNNTLRWCTRQIKVDPMTQALADRIDELDGNILMITGVRQGESAIRDGRIAMSCGKDGAECGQGWYQQVLPQAKGIRGRIATLAPLLHWRVCNVWDWLKIYAPLPEYGGWETATVADAYGGDEAEELNARTGCTGCPLTENDKALDTVIAAPKWSYLAPLKGLKPIYRELRKPHNRLRKPGIEVLKSGRVAANPQRMGPLTFSARLWALGEILSIQDQVNSAARALGRPEIDILNDEEEARIRELIAAETWPQGWDGDEPTADTPIDTVYADGSVQPLFI